MPQKVKAKKQLGQHFLTDTDIARRIALCISADQLPPEARQWGGLPVLEIGPGMGVLTQYLLESGRTVKAVELDSESVAYLAKVFPALPVIEGDFLRLDPSAVFPGDFALIGNYPYNISSQIFFRLLDWRERVPVCAGMLQKEVAERLCAGPGSKTYGILSVLLALWYDREYLFTVDENVFSPPPKVKSGVIRLTRNSRTSLPCDERKLRTIVKTAFGQRRKTLRNSLSGLIPQDSPLRQDPVMAMRPEQLSPEEFIRITSLL